jgi:hypothetical protein
MDCLQPNDMGLLDFHIQAYVCFTFRLAIALHMSEIGLLIRVLTSQAGQCRVTLTRRCILVKSTC